MQYLVLKNHASERGMHLRGTKVEYPKGVADKLLAKGTIGNVVVILAKADVVEKTQKTKKEK